jgi:hypothetical protein
MNKKLKYIILIALTIFLAGNICISFFIYNQKKQLLTDKQITQNSIGIKLLSIIQKHFEIENRSLIINNFQADLLKNYIGNDTVLILYIDKYSCSLCIDNAIADLLSFKDRVNSQNILVIFSTENNKGVTLLKNQIKNSFNILTVKEDDIKFDGISDHLPIHFFVIDKNLKPFCVYFYASEFTELNRAYFNIIYRRFLKKRDIIDKHSQLTVTTVEPNQTGIELRDLHTGKTSEVIFTLKNTGTNPLVIQMVNASCGCTVPEWEKQPIAVGSSTEIKVKITPETSGYFNKTVTVHCNTEEGQISLKVKGMVE